MIIVFYQGEMWAMCRYVFKLKRNKSIYVLKKGRKRETGKCSHVRFVNTVSNHIRILSSLSTRAVRM